MAYIFLCWQCHLKWMHPRTCLVGSLFVSSREVHKGITTRAGTTTSVTITGSTGRRKAIQSLCIRHRDSTNARLLTRKAACHRCILGHRKPRISEKIPSQGSTGESFRTGRHNSQTPSAIKTSSRNAWARYSTKTAVIQRRNLFGFITFRQHPLRLQASLGADDCA